MKFQESEEQKQFKTSSLPHKELRVAIYEPESKLRYPIKFLQDMWFSLLSCRELAWQLLIRDVSAQYRQTFLGLLWAFVPPIVTAVGLTLLKNSNVLNLGKTSIPYPVYVMFSMSLWQVFTDALNGAMTSAKTARNMLFRIKVPGEAFVLAKIGQVLFNFGIQLILIIFLFMWFKVKVSWTAILAPVALIHLIMLGTAIGLFLGPISALYGDVYRMMGFLLRFGIFVTPVLYPVPKQGLWATIVTLNPVTPLLVTTRELVIGNDISFAVEFWIASLIAIIGVFLGWIFFHLALPFLVERASS